MRGRNPSGKAIIAAQVTTHLPAPRYSPEAGSGSEAGLSLVVAAGPFTCSDNLGYEPLEGLLAACSQNKPQVGHTSAAALRLEGATLMSAMHHRCCPMRPRHPGGMWIRAPAVPINCSHTQ